MNRLVYEWISKAEGDFLTAQREMRVRKSPNFDAVCFHSQQCAEKLLKAMLQDAAIPFGKTHNLIILLEMLLPQKPDLEILRLHLDYLTAFSVQYRYPGDSADREMGREALKSCAAVRDYLAQAHNLIPKP